jgi:DNA modification methylase
MKINKSKKNTLMLGDNLILLQNIPDASVDLIYLDPPFNSKRNHIIVDKDSDGETEVKYFRDIWKGGSETYHKFLFDRLLHMRRILKSTGSIYLHCDTTESHYIKVMLDKIFGRKNFRNEIAWCYSGPANTKRYFPRKHDIIFFYAASDKYVHNEIRVPHCGKLSVGGKSSWAGTKWNSSDHAQRLVRGKLLEDWWKDIPALQRNEKERCGYPTQKPIKLLERIIQASSNEDDVVLDPFMGSGTTMIAAHGLGRQFIGMDMHASALDMATKRLKRKGATFNVIQTINHPPDISLRVDGTEVQAVINKSTYEIVNFVWWVDKSPDNSTPWITIDKKGYQDFFQHLSDGQPHTITCLATDEQGSSTTKSIMIELQ